MYINKHEILLNKSHLFLSIPQFYNFSILLKMLVHRKKRLVKQLYCAVCSYTYYFSEYGKVSIIVWNSSVARLG